MERRTCVDEITDDHLTGLVHRGENAHYRRDGEATVPTEILAIIVQLHGVCSDVLTTPFRRPKAQRITQ